MKLMNVAYLISWNLQGAHRQSSGMGFYYHIAHCVTCKYTWEEHFCDVLKCKYVSLESLVFNVDLFNEMKYACTW